MDQHMKLKCGDYLHHVLHGVITEVEEVINSHYILIFLILSYHSQAIQIVMI